VDDTQVFVHVDRFDRQILGHEGAGLRRLAQGDEHPLPQPDLGRGLAGRLPIEQHVTGFDALLQVTARKFCEVGGQDTVQPLPMQTGVD